MSDEKGQNKIPLVVLGCVAASAMMFTLCFTKAPSLASFVAGGFGMAAAFFWAAAMWGGE